ncbi:hypothetical protein BH09BAC5_BH09BAC5_21640 [soil metagenome]
MENSALNVFIVDDSKMMVGALKKYLSTQFGSTINVSEFYDGESCIKHIEEYPNVVILDYFLDTKQSHKKNGLEILKIIKVKSPATEVIMLTSNDNVFAKEEAMQSGASGYIIKKRSSWQQTQQFIYRSILRSIRQLKSEFGLKEYFFLFGVTIAGIAIALSITLHFGH